MTDAIHAASPHITQGVAVKIVFQTAAGAVLTPPGSGPTIGQQSEAAA